MPSYTIKNLKQVTDMAPQFGYAPDLEARFARADLECERTGLSYQRLAPNAEAPFAHRHNEDEEIYVVVSGSGKAKLGDEVIVVGTWDAIRVAPGTVRAFAAGPEGLELLAFGTHAEDDAVMEEASFPAE
jgi:mannose-6-phosphate isomerase-like protein (cupin superfamily)